MRRPGQVYTFGEFRLDAGGGTLVRRPGDTPVALTRPAFDALLELVARAGEVVERRTLQAAVWPHVTVVDNSLNQAVAALRRALDDDAQAPRYVSTTPKRGYRFIAEVIAEDAAARDPRAYQHYVTGWSFMSRPGGGNLRSAIECFEQAVALDADFALAWVCMADCYLVETSHGPRTPAELLPRAGEAISRALALEPQLAEAQAILAHYQSTADMDHAASARTLAGALALNPQCFWANRGVGRDRLMRGDFEGALAAFRQAQAIQPMAVNISGNIGMTYYFAGRYDEAIAQLEHSLRMDDRFEVARSFLGRSLMRLGDVERAMEHFQRPRVAHGAAADIPIAHALSGRTNAAREALARLQARAEQGQTLATEIASLHAVLGEQEQALTWLEHAVAQHRPGFFTVDPLFTRLRSQQRFQRLVQRMGLV